MTSPNQKTLAIVDYGSGNLRSAAKAFERAAREAGLAFDIVVTADADLVARADRIVLPGVGAFADCKAGLDSLDGMVAALEDAVLKRSVPFLGICVGMQLMASVGREHGDCRGLDWIAGDIVAIDPADPSLKVPHMGWNTLSLQGDHPVLNGLDNGTHVYFVHSYHYLPKSRDHVLAEVDYGGALTAVVGRDNMIGTQFHPEKSQDAGLKLFANFLQWSA
ncbi:imidazole glycerol phosphate synthase subunit HisH [Kiloniella sp. b19]|uniref:imidazole glycerol phosphate synthase subunit HisH n=1 Tax=Kiloniella sp. GXU_MW_B19 TaxID=3141326 RepID=UPI0031DC0287